MFPENYFAKSITVADVGQAISLACQTAANLTNTLPNDWYMVGPISAFDMGQTIFIESCSVKSGEVEKFEFSYGTDRTVTYAPNSLKAIAFA